MRAALANAAVLAAAVTSELSGLSAKVAKPQSGVNSTRSAPTIRNQASSIGLACVSQMEFLCSLNVGIYRRRRRPCGMTS